MGNGAGSGARLGDGSGALADMQACEAAGLSLGIYSLMADPDESALARAAQESAPGKFLVANVSAAAAPFVQPSREKGEPMPFGNVQKVDKNSRVFW